MKMKNEKWNDMNQWQAPQSKAISLPATTIARAFVIDDDVEKKPNQLPSVLLWQIAFTNNNNNNNKEE